MVGDSILYDLYVRDLIGVLGKTDSADVGNLACLLEADRQTRWGFVACKVCVMD
jgi:hypothetical protein